MVLPVPTDTTVDLEAAWLADDPALVAYVTPTPYARMRADGSKSADLRITATTERRVSNGRKELVHTFELRITWPLVSAASSMADDQRYLEACVKAVRDRLRGPQLDHTHDGLFESVAEEDGIAVTYSDPVAALALETPVITATVTYQATALEIVN